MSRLDLLVCRNVLMYFNPELQGHILSRFNYALITTAIFSLAKPKHCSCIRLCLCRSH